MTAASGAPAAARCAPVAPAGEVSNGSAVRRPFEQVAQIVGAAGQQLLVAHHRGVAVEVDVRAHQCGDLLRELIEATLQH